MPETPLRSLPWHAGKGAGAPSGIGRWVAGLLAGRGKQTYAEPFAGMLGVLLQRPRAHEEVASDVDGRLLAWWRAVRDEPDALTARLAATPLFSKPHLDEAHVVAPDAEQSDVVRAAALAVICMTAWNGSTYRYVSPSTRGWPTVPDLARRLQLVSIWGCSAAETIERLTGRSLATRASSLAYCDPPYPGTSDKYGGFDAAAAADFEVAVLGLAEAGWDVAVSAAPGGFPTLEAHWATSSFQVPAFMGAKQGLEQRTEILVTSWQPAPTLFG